MVCRALRRQGVSARRFSRLASFSQGVERLFCEARHGPYADAQFFCLGWETEP